MALRLSKSSNRNDSKQFAGESQVFCLWKSSQLQPRQICGILSNGRLPQLPRRNVCLRFSKILEVNLYYPVHPGIAKQVMEPATLWFERRVRRVQTCDKRQTLSPRPGMRGNQRAATIHRFCINSLTNSVCALSGQAVPQGAFAVLGEQ
jgi:hypothetical protein